MSGNGNLNVNESTVNDPMNLFLNKIFKKINNFLDGDTLGDNNDTLYCGVIPQVGVGIISAISFPQGEHYLIDIRSSLYDCAIEAIFGEKDEMLTGSCDWSEEIAELKKCLERPPKREERVLFFIFQQFLEILQLTYEDHKVAEALARLLALRTLALHMVERRRLAGSDA